MVSFIQDAEGGSDDGENKVEQSGLVGATFTVASSAVVSGHSLDPLWYSVPPRWSAVAEDTTTPGARAMQLQNPYLGGLPSKSSRTRIEIWLRAKG